MNIFNSTEQFSISQTSKVSTPFIATIGNFDGVHLGHQKLFEKMQKIAQIHGWKVLVITFSPHPRQVLNPDLKVEAITDNAEKLALLQKSGVTDCLVEHFTLDFSKQPYELYLQKILDTFDIRYFLMGHDFMFGANRAGSFEKLKRYCQAKEIACEQIEAYLQDGQTVSSSLIRKLIQQGQMADVKKYLGRPFSLAGKVIKGAGRGKQLGFPTANIKLYDQILPPKGVYVVHAYLQGQIFKAITNVGDQPTFKEQGPTTLQLVETHFLDFNQDIYEQTVRVEFLEFIRPEQKFAGKDSLIAQISRDIQYTRDWFTE